MSRFDRTRTLCLATLLVLASLFALTVLPKFAEAAHRVELSSAAEESDAIGIRGGSFVAPPSAQSAGRDTAYFGSVNEEGFAILGEAWTWDHGGPDPMEGWYATDLSHNPRAFFRRITAEIWTNGDGGGPTNNAVPAPILSGVGSLYCGVFENEADNLCWNRGLGYGNNWCQRTLSPVVGSSGTGDIGLAFTYFNDTEIDFDYSKLILRRVPSGVEIALNGDGFTNQVGLATNHPTSPPSGVLYETTVDASDLGDDTSFQIVFEVTSDGGWSDEDGAYATDYGPFGVDDLSLTGDIAGGDVVFSFETDLEGWTVETCLGVGSFVGVADVSRYMVAEACGCRLSGNILELHDDGDEHPDGQHVMVRSNPIDVANDLPVLNGPGNGRTILAEWDQYSDMPRANGVFYRPGWDYYPFTCPSSGNVQWSGRVGQDNYIYVATAGCARVRSSAAPAGIPLGVEQLRFIYEVYSSCDAFGIPPDVCTEVTNFSPIIDNVMVGFTRSALAPIVAFAPGTQYQDGFSQDDVFMTSPGNADVTVNTNWGSSQPIVLGDSLYIVGPNATSSTRWEARLWFRIARESPLSPPTGYTTWKNALADGKNITGGEFTFAWMDSFQLGTQTAKNKFVSYLRETDDDYNAGGGEQSSVNEIIRDGILPPGTSIEYFVSTNYTATPNELFTLPDTLGGHFLEFEILPSFRTASKFPCLLYIDAHNGATEPIVGHALEELGIEFDRYDYQDATSNWKAPLARGHQSASNNGTTVYHLLGYRTILLTTGAASQSMFPVDFELLSSWLTAYTCNGNVNRQGLILNGDRIGSVLDASGGAFFNYELGGILVSDSYRSFSGNPDQCIRVDAPPVGGEAYGTDHQGGDYEYDAYGCSDFSVIGATPAGVGNRAFIRIDPFQVAHYSQIVRVDDSSTAKYRSVVDGISYHHVSDRDAVLECVGDSAHIATAATNEIRAALEWIYGSLGSVPSLCESHCGYTAGFDDVPFDAGVVTHLYPAEPNPFHPRTLLRFSLARSGEVQLSIFDAQGRLVRDLVNARLDAGLHERIWDGTDRRGHLVASGVYWSQLEVDATRSNRKLVLLR